MTKINNNSNINTNDLNKTDINEKNINNKTKNKQKGFFNGLKNIVSHFSNSNNQSVNNKKTNERGVEMLNENSLEKNENKKIKDILSNINKKFHVTNKTPNNFTYDEIDKMIDKQKTQIYTMTDAKENKIQDGKNAIINSTQLTPEQKITLLDKLEQVSK